MNDFIQIILKILDSRAVDKASAIMSHQTQVPEHDSSQTSASNPPSSPLVLLTSSHHVEQPLTC